ncbi:hypothetical protein D9M72_42990 [compost metagenome]
MDYRLLLSGYLPEYLYSLGALQGADSPQAYRRAGNYTERARATRDASQYSHNIRLGVPGVTARQPEGTAGLLRQVQPPVR